MKINRAVLGDAKKILQIQKCAYLSEAEIYHDYGISPLIETLEEIKQDFSEQVFLKAVEDSIQLVQCVVTLRKKQHISDG
jgi:hypothetical protein